MKKSFAVTLMSFLLLLQLACAPKKETSMDALEEQEQADSQLKAVPNPDLYSNGQTKLIKTVDYRFEVVSVKKSTEEIELAIKKYPAYISASDLRLEGSLLENSMTIRVRNEYFQDLLKEIDTQAHFVNYRNVKTEDVAKQFVDLESRLKTKREVEERYMEILRKKAGTIEELLDAERQIGALHEEIEATISRINHLKEEVCYSTIRLEFYQTINPDAVAQHETPISRQFGEALLSGWSALVSIALALTYIWPLLVLSAVVFYVFRYMKRRKLAMGR